jgi:hypothetical protein
VPISDDADPEILINRLAGPLEPAARVAFRQAALDALTRVPCQGEGIVYRTLAPLQRAFFDPPDGTSWDISQERPSGKLTQGPRFSRRLRMTR